jgi:hypothetical protein
VALQLDRYEALRPWLFHFTARSNLASIRYERILHSVRVLAPHHTSESRRSAVGVWRDAHEITVRDQRALRRGHVELVGGWRWDDLVSALNARVFFWPGLPDGRPNEYGRRHLDAYPTGQIQLRVRFQDLIASNRGLTPYFCRYNSGGPRCFDGHRVPRGPDTFRMACDWPDTPSRVIEVSFVGSVSLPRTTEVLDGGQGWQPL